jgi:hypothetical protein
MKKQQQQIIEKKRKKPKTSSQMERVMMLMMMIPFESPLKSHDLPLQNKIQWCPKKFPYPC